MIKSAVIYFLGGILNKSIPFLLLPILTRYLAPEEYGVWALFQVLLAFVIPFVGMNMHSNISCNFAKMTRSELSQLIGLLVGILGITTGLTWLFIVTLIIYHGSAFGIPSAWLLMMPFVAALSMLHQFNLTVLRNQDRPLMFGCFEVGSTFVNLGLSLILIVGLGFKWQGRAIGVAGAALCFGIAGVVALRRQKLLTFKFDRLLVGEILRISFPLVPHALGSIIIVLSDRLFIERLISKEAVGLYVVGYTFGMVVDLVVVAFNRSWTPWFYRQMVDITDEGRQDIVRYTYASFGLLLLLAFVVTGASYLIFPVMVPAEYHAATEFILWVALGYAFRGMYTMIFPYYVFVGKTNMLGVGTAGAALANLLLNYLLICKNGPVGAAQATMFSWLMQFLCAWVYSVRICPMPWLIFFKGNLLRSKRR